MGFVGALPKIIQKNPLRDVPAGIDTEQFYLILLNNKQYRTIPNIQFIGNFSKFINKIRIKIYLLRNPAPRNDTYDTFGIA